MTKSRKNKALKRQKQLMMLSFASGAIVMLLFIQIIGLFARNISITIPTNASASLKPAIKKIYDAAVLIETYTGKEKSSTGSGFVYKVDEKYAYVLTNEHVIEGDTIMITMSSEEQAEGKLLGKEPYLDLAVIRIDKKYAKKVATIGNSEKTEIGDSIFVVGSPLGENYQGSISSGILSGKDRMVQTTVGATMSDNSWLMSVMQFDAAINPGNSGGPLLNANGEVIGIVTMKLIKEEIEGMSFAIPIEQAMKNIDKIEKGQSIKWPDLGMSMVNVSGDISMYKNISVPSNVKDGIIVLSTNKGGSAEKAKLKRGDIITKINGKKIKNTAYLKYELFKYKIGEEIEITYIRNKKEYKVSVKLNSSK